MYIQQKVLIDSSHLGEKKKTLGLWQSRYLHICTSIAHQLAIM